MVFQSTSRRASAHFHSWASGSAISCRRFWASLSRSRGSSNQDAGVLLVREEIAVERAAGGLVGLGADEAGDGGVAGHAGFGQEALDVPGARAVALLGDLAPDRELASRVGGDREGFEAFEVDPVVAVGSQKLGRDVAEAEALLDGAFGNAEAGRDGGDGGAGIGERGEGLDLVGWVHGRSDDVLRKRDLRRRGAGRQDAAGHGHVGGNLAFLGEVDERLVAAAAGDDGVEIGGGVDRLDDEVGEDAERGDVGLELGRGLEAGGRSCGRSRPRARACGGR